MAEPYFYEGKNGVQHVINDPENITSQECLALSLAGKDVWNKWRELYPNYRSNGVLRNAVSFANQDLSAYAGLNFQDFIFGEGTNFRGARFPSKCYFERAQFGKGASFDGAVFQGWTRFVDAKFGSRATFNHAQFADHIDFSKSKFEELVEFNNTHFSTSVRFEECVFGGHVEFDKISGNGLMSFTNAEFKGSIKFSNEINRRHINFQGAIIHDKALFYQLKASEGIIFDNVEFKSVAAFNDVFFSSWTSFYKTIFNIAPEFHGCKFHQDTTFGEAQFPIATGSEESARAYRTLKLAFSAQQATREEQFFFRREMAEDALRAKPFFEWFKLWREKRKLPNADSELDTLGAPRIYYNLYGWLSGYGSKVFKPLMVLVLTPIVLTLLLNLALADSALHWNTTLPFSAPMALQQIGYAMSHGLPLLGLGKTTVPMLTDLFGSATNWQALLAEGLGVAQQLIALIGWFLAGLALRNIFKMK